MTSFSHDGSPLAPNGDAASDATLLGVGEDAGYATARFINNATSAERLSMKTWTPARSGAEDALRLRSFGAGC